MPDKSETTTDRVFAIASPTLHRFNWRKRKRDWGYWMIEIDTMTASVMTRRWRWCTETAFLWDEPIMGMKAAIDVPRPGLPS